MMAASWAPRRTRWSSLSRAVIDDRRADALQIVLVVEIVDEYVALLDLADGDGCDKQRIGIDVAVIRHGRAESVVVFFSVSRKFVFATAGAAATTGPRAATNARESPRLDLLIIHVLTHIHCIERGRRRRREAGSGWPRRRWSCGRQIRLHHARADSESQDSRCRRRD